MDPDALAEQVKDPLGTFYRFDYASSHLGRIRIKREEVKEE
jgi:hypothetical protein